MSNCSVLHFGLSGSQELIFYHRLGKERRAIRCWRAPLSLSLSVTSLFILVRSLSKLTTERCPHALPFSPVGWPCREEAFPTMIFEYSEPPRGAQLGTKHPFHPRSLSPSLALYYTPSASFTLRKPDVFKEEGTQSFQNPAETGVPDWWALFLTHLGHWGTCMLTGRLGCLSGSAELGARILPVFAMYPLSSTALSVKFLCTSAL